MSEEIENLTTDLPDAESAKRFFSELESKHRSEANKLLREQNRGLLSDVLALSAWSPFLATTLLQHPEYIVWLGRNRREKQNRTPEDLLESLARFALTNSALDTHTLLARFRRRELLRIYLNDIRNLVTIAETTEELSNLADACLEHALRVARQELDNRFGVPLESDEKGKARRGEFCVVALGKLGSRELNYASDIDLLFLYSSDGMTSGTGARGSVSNREYFVKLAEKLTNIVGSQSNEGAAYRVDLRLRPHGRVGGLAISIQEAANYYKQTARDWERQVLLRSRSAAGDAPLFRRFWSEIESFVYRTDVSVEDALAAVRLSKQKINQEQRAENGFNVKLGTGGIREIEFIAQALQLARGGSDAWLRAPHTLIALRRLADRAYLAENELAALSDAYVFLRRLEHRLQMEHGLQTHAVPDDGEKRRLIARRMNFSETESFDESLSIHTAAVNRIFEKVFRVRNADYGVGIENADLIAPIETQIEQIVAEAAIKTDDSEFQPQKYSEILQKAVSETANFHDELAVLRVEWRKFYEEIRQFDAAEKLSLFESKRLQTELAEAAINAALLISKKEMSRRFHSAFRSPHSALDLAVLGLGKLGSGGMDFGSDLDLILIFDDSKESPVDKLTNAEFYAHAAEIFVSSLSSLTREGFLYRVDLRLRPDGKNGAVCSGASSFLDYVRARAAVWEWLAYVKLRAAAGNLEFARSVEENARKNIHERACEIGKTELKTETKRVRELLEREKAKNLRRGEIDIKYGAGGLLDVYFAVRFLQLRDNVPDENENRSTSASLERLRAAGSLDEEDFTALTNGYDFLRRVDHALRLAAGRATRIPSSSHPLLNQVAVRLQISEKELLELLVLRTTEIRAAFNRLFR
ncbi:MAG TPA: hypothetical protein VGB02_20905 [Pyrinomonadaceae bacterium]